MLVATVASAGLMLTGCGGTSQDAHEPSGTFAVRIAKASFPTSQLLAQPSTLSIAVTNAGSHDIPNVGVTIGGPRGGNDFTVTSKQPGLADPSRPIWVVDTGPSNGTTAYRNTWTLGKLKPNETKTFTWRLTALRSGLHTIDYRVNAGLNGKSKAELPNGRAPTGSIAVNIVQTAPRSCVDDAGNVVRQPARQGKTNRCVSGG